MEPLTTHQRREALEHYLTTLETLSFPAQLNRLPLPHGLCPHIQSVRWGVPMIDQLVENELSELTNTLNEWRSALRRWYVWLEVLARYDEQTAWALQWEFVESIAFQCLFYPSATRDRFGFVATNALHQARMTADSAYKDVLDQDPKKPDGKQRMLTRPDREAQLSRIAEPYEGRDTFMDRLQSLDGKDYRNLTRDYRNRASHAIAPRLSVGLTNIVVRRVVPATKLVEQENGFYKEEVIPNRQQVSYGFGGLPPLPLREVFAANLAESEKARTCFMSYVDMFNGALASLADE
ncbi:hypothetical protein [Ralstonia pseudosolanacearum]|uniref:hypothetical protein n=2 Tax=Ralstonia pseudosolanacearum TaxID=1310165 RepID=UPI002004762F|nr:hypothetical protein [Ralstonia pseudosolanacearum]MCK4151998.1 hypothetical protein [Ralstonia pseudosolanacearum]